MLTVATPAPDLALLSTEELRAAAGVSDGANDAALSALGLEIALSIARACNVAQAGSSTPTLRSEALVETFRNSRQEGAIALSRRPVTAIASIVADGVALDADEYETDEAAGLVYRLADDIRTWWPAAKVVVTYTAGFATVPPDLKLAAKKMLVDLWGAASRDPNLKRVVVEGVGEREYWVSPTTDPLVSSEVMDLLSPYRNHWIR